MDKEVFIDKHAVIDVVHVDKDNIEDICRLLHPQNLVNGTYLYWRPTGMGEDEDVQFEMGDYLVHRWDNRIDDYNWFCYSRAGWLSEKEDYVKVGEMD